MTKRWLPNCPWCHEPMYVRDLDLEDEPWFLTECSAMHHACLVGLQSAMQAASLSGESGARQLLTRDKNYCV